MRRTKQRSDGSALWGILQFLMKSTAELYTVATFFVVLRIANTSSGMMTYMAYLGSAFSLMATWSIWNEKKNASIVWFIGMECMLFMTSRHTFDSLVSTGLWVLPIIALVSIILGIREEIH